MRSISKINVYVKIKMYFKVYGVAECRWYLVSLFIKYRLPPIFYILALINAERNCYEETATLHGTL